MMAPYRMGYSWRLQCSHCRPRHSEGHAEKIRLIVSPNSSLPNVGCDSLLETWVRLALVIGHLVIDAKIGRSSPDGTAPEVDAGYHKKLLEKDRAEISFCSMI
jgi:hypothetical protein